MLKAIETQYKGYRFRSRLEARWAVFLDALHVEWTYEAEGYDLDGIWYLPDFWLPAQSCWLEVKGREATEEECEKAGRLAVASKSKVHILWGDISMPDNERSGIQTFQYDSRDSSLMPYPVAYPNLDWTNEYRFCNCPLCGRGGITIHGGVHHLPCKCLDELGHQFHAAFMDTRANLLDHIHEPADYWLVRLHHWYKSVFSFFHAADSPRVLDAYETACSARFEHGETPR